MPSGSLTGVTTSVVLSMRSAWTATPAALSSTPRSSSSSTRC